MIPVTLIVAAALLGALKLRYDDKDADRKLRQHNEDASRKHALAMVKVKANGGQS